MTFGDVLDVAVRPAKIEDRKQYQLIVAKRSRGGIVPREMLLGRDIKTKAQFFVATGDFLISNRQIIHGACGIVPPELDGALISGEYSTLRPRNDLYLDYLGWYSHSTHFQQTCFHSSVGVDVEKMVFRFDRWLRESFHLPPIEEQHRIADILSRWKGAVDANQRLIDALKRRKRSYIQELLGGRSRLPKGEARKIRKLAEIAELCRDSVSPQEADKDFDCIELEHIVSGEGRLLGRVGVRGQDSLKNHVMPGDVLFGKLRPYLRKFHFARKECVCSSEIWVLRANSHLCVPEYLFYLVQSDAFHRAANISAGSKMPRADWRVVSELRLSIPPVQEQLKIAQLLRSVDDEIALLRAREEKLRLQQVGLMQHFF